MIDDRERPDAEFIKRDDQGQELHAYLTEYAYEGSGWWCSIVWANNAEDAQARVAALRASSTQRFPHER